MKNQVRMKYKPDHLILRVGPNCLTPEHNAKRVMLNLLLISQ